MSQINKGFRARFLGTAAGYEFFQNLVRRKGGDGLFVQDYLAPFDENCRLLDVGCGTGDILDSLPLGIDYTGIDLSLEYIDAARVRYGQRGEFHCMSVEELSSGSGEYDIILAKGVLHHIDDSAVRGLAQVAGQLLSPNGRFITVDPVYWKGQSRLARYLISKDRGQSVRTPEGYENLMKAAFDGVDSVVRDDMLRIPYTHMIMTMRAD